MTIVHPAQGPYGEVMWGAYWAPPPHITSGVSDAPLRSKFSVRAKGYDTLIVRWEEPTDNYDYIALVRGSYGPPLTIRDGDILLQVPKGTYPSNEAIDSGLKSGSYYYYSLFARIATATPQWVRLGTGYGLVPSNYSSGQWMTDFLPRFYFEADGTLPGHPTDPEMAPWGPLRRFLELLGREVDLFRTETTTLIDSWDPDKIRSDLLLQASEQYGFSYEPYIGDRQMRRLFANWIHINKRKGTSVGIEAAASAISGYSATVTVGWNLLLDRNDSEAYESTGHWLDSTLPPIVNLSLTRSTTHVWLPATQRASLRVQRIGPGINAIIQCSGVPGFALGTPLIGAFAIPVAAGSSFWFIFATQATTAIRDVRGVLIWFDSTGTYLSSDIRVPDQPQIVGAWVAHTYSTPYVAPVGAAYVIPVIDIESTASSEVHYVSGIQLRADDGTGLAANNNTFEPARRVKVQLAPTRRNLVSNPSFEINTTGWTAVSNCTIARSTALSFVNVGIASLKITITANGNAVVHFPLTQASFYGTYDESTHYGMSFRVHGTTGNIVTATAQAQLRWLNGSSVQLLSTLGTAVPITGSGWTTVPAQAENICPIGAVTADLRVLINGGLAGEEYYIDAVLFEENPILSSYFDGSIDPTSADLGWEGAVHNSASTYYPNKFIRDKRLRALMPNFIPVLTDFDAIYRAPGTL